MGLWGNLISGGASLLGLGASYESSRRDRSQAADIAANNLAMQREFAQEGIRWKVADAKAAGIHPLAALGASTHSYTPQQMFTGGKTDFSKFGQNLSRSMNAGRTQAEREILQLDIQQKKEQLKHMKLQNMGLLKDLNDVNPVPPKPVAKDPFDAALGIIGQSDGARKGRIKEYDIADPALTFVKPKVPYSRQPGIKAGMPPLEQFFYDQEGKAWRVPSNEAKEGMEDNIFLEGQYSGGRIADWLKHLFYGLFVNYGSKARDELRKNQPRKRIPGHEWRYDKFKGLWKSVPYKKGSRPQLYLRDKRFRQERR